MCKSPDPPNKRRQTNLIFFHKIYSQKLGEKLGCIFFRFCDDGLKLLCELCDLEMLDLSETRVTGEGVRELLHMDSLIKLSINSTRVRKDFEKYRILNKFSLHRYLTLNREICYFCNYFQFFFEIFLQCFCF